MDHLIQFVSIFSRFNSIWQNKCHVDTGHTHLHPLQAAPVFWEASWLQQLLESKLKNKINDKKNLQESETEVCFSFHSNTIDAENIDNVQSLSC